MQNIKKYHFRATVSKIVTSSRRCSRGDILLNCFEQFPDELPGRQPMFQCVEGFCATPASVTDAGEKSQSLDEPVSSAAQG